MWEQKQYNFKERMRESSAHTDKWTLLAESSNEQWSTGISNSLSVRKRSICHHKQLSAPTAISSGLSCPMFHWTPRISAQIRYLHAQSGNGFPGFKAKALKTTTRNGCRMILWTPSFLSHCISSGSSYYFGDTVYILSPWGNPKVQILAYSTQHWSSATRSSE